MESKKGISPGSIFYLNNFHLFQNQNTFHYLLLIYLDDLKFFKHLHLNFQEILQDFKLFYKISIKTFNHPIKKKRLLMLSHLL